MKILDLLFMSLGLSMDAFAVAISDLFAYRSMSKLRMLLIPVVFAVVQGGLLLIGYFCGHLLPQGVDKYAGIASCVILSVIGGKMIWDAVHEKPENATGKVLSVPMLAFQSIATSLDALFIGVSLAMESQDIVLSCVVIGLVTLVVALAAVLIGRGLGSAFGEKLGQRATIFGGVVLIIIGIVELF